MDIYNTDYTQAEGQEARRAGGEFLRKDREIGADAARELPKALQGRREDDFRHRRGRLSARDNARQFAIMVRYGMTPMQAIQAATLNARRRARA